MIIFLLKLIVFKKIGNNPFLILQNILSKLLNRSISNLNTHLDNIVHIDKYSFLHIYMH